MEWVLLGIVVVLIVWLVVVYTGISRMAGRSGHPAVSVSAILLLMQR